MCIGDNDVEYRVYVVIEAYDGDGTLVDEGIYDGCACAKFDTVDQALEFANILDDLGVKIAKKRGCNYAD